MAKQKSAYAQKLLDPRWQKMRLEILQRDEWKCQHCDEADKTLHIHHTRYQFGLDPWEYDPATLVTLCFECHETAEAVRSDTKVLIEGLSLGVQLSLVEVLREIAQTHSTVSMFHLMKLERTLHSLRMKAFAAEKARKLQTDN